MKLIGAAGIAAFSIGLGACTSDPVEVGEFERVGSYLTGAHPVTGAVFDIDGDGDLDAIFPALISEDVVALINNDGDLEWRQLTPLAMGASDALVLDAVGDERPELVLSNRDRDRVMIYEVTAGPDLVLAGELDVRGATGLEAADLDGDGRLDLLVTCFNDDAVALFRRGPLGLDSAGELDTSSGPYRVRAADIDGDGAAEVFVVAAGGARVDVFDGALDSLSLEVSVETAAWPSSLTIVDRNSDGRPDIYGTTNQGDSVFELVIDSETAPWTVRKQVVAMGDGAFDVTAVDTDGAGGLELAVTNKSASTVTILGESGLGGPLEPRVELVTGDDAGPSPVFVWDYDGDQRSDLLVVNAFTDEVVVFRGQPGYVTD